MSRRVLALTLLLALSASATTIARSPAAIPIVLDMDGRIAVTVRINGSGPYRFRLDTGTSRSVIGRPLAAALRLPPAGQSRTITHTGQASYDLVRAGVIAVGANGEMHADELALLVLPSEAIDRTGRMDGILGQDVLSRWICTIDYRERRLWLSLDSVSPARAVRLPLVRVGGSLLATVDLGGTAGPLRVVPDSGADRLVLFGQPARMLPPLTLRETVRVRSVAGETSARLAYLDRLEVSGIPIGGHEALLLPDRPAGGAMGDGLLPLHLFGRVTFDLPASSLWLERRR